MRQSIIGASVLGCILGLGSVGRADDHGHDHKAPPMPKFGVCVMEPKSESKVAGTITFAQQGKDIVVKGEISGLKPGLHGFHIHELGDLRSKDGASAGGHFNPGGHKHGGPETAEKHVGDLGNVKANDEGVATVDLTIKDYPLHFIVGRSLVVHADPDDLTSQPAGNAGPRVGVGVIGIAAK